MINNVRRLRTRSGMTQDELAGMIGTSKSHICEVEKGHNVPGVYRAMDIANALGVSVYAAFPHTDYNESGDTTKKTLATLIECLEPMLGTSGVHELTYMLNGGKDG